MIQYMVKCKDYESEIYESLESTKLLYYDIRRRKIKRVPEEDVYVEIVYSDNNFEDCNTLVRSEIIIDEEAHEKFGSPRDNRFDFDYWCKWKETEY